MSKHWLFYNEAGIYLKIDNITSRGKYERGLKLSEGKLYDLSFVSFTYFTLHNISMQNHSAN